MLGAQVVQDYLNKDPSSGTQYAIKTNNLATNSKYNLVQIPAYYWLVSLKLQNYYYVKFNILKNNEVSYQFMPKFLILESNLIMTLPN